MTNQVRNTDDVIDSRDVQARIEEIEGEITDAEDSEAAGEDVDEVELEEIRVELADLEAFKEEAISATSEWDYGATFISADYFQDYARELAEDIGAISRDAEWPLCCIDWEQASDLLKQDYSTADFDGREYFVVSS